MTTTRITGIAKRRRGGRGEALDGPSVLEVFDTSMRTVQYARAVPDVKFNAVEPGIVVQWTTNAADGPTGTSRKTTASCVGERTGNDVAGVIGHDW